jgi:PAS domain S-box-containing protein
MAQAGQATALAARPLSQGAATCPSTGAALSQGGAEISAPPPLVHLTGRPWGRRLDGVSRLRDMGGDIEGALEDVRVPSYVVDRHGIIRWVNPAAQRLVGDVRGRQFTSVVSPEETRRAREVFARNVSGTVERADNEVVVLGADGSRVTVDLSAVPLRQGGKVIGMFGQVVDVDEEKPPPAHPDLTPRQTEVLRLLEHGRSTEQIAGQLHLSPETVRNHIRHILRALDVHSRLEAVAVARREHLVPAGEPET